MPETGCPFCLIDGQKNRILAQGWRVVVILSNPRLMEGHALVVPHRHVQSLHTLTEEERRELFDTVIYFQEKIKKVFGPGAGCDISQHDRPFMPKTRLSVPGHVHFHLKPRIWKDEYYEKVLKHETDMFQPLSPGEQDKVKFLLVE